jgi:hypothetical protein
MNNDLVDHSVSRNKCIIIWAARGLAMSRHIDVLRHTRNGQLMQTTSWLTISQSAQPLRRAQTRLLTLGWSGESAPRASPDFRPICVIENATLLGAVAAWAANRRELLSDRDPG